MLNLDTPGGEVTGINEFAQMIFDARGKKPIVAYVDGMAASAGYWIASAADEIVTDETGLLGSIGVVAAVPNPDARSAREVQFVSSQSPKKRPNPNTESGREQLQAMVDDLATVFVRTVARNRSVTESDVLDRFGQGAVLVGANAVQAGLADRLGSFEGVIAELAAGNWRRKSKPQHAAEEQLQPEVATQPEAAEENDMGLIEKIKALLAAEAGDAIAEPAAATAQPQNDQAERLAIVEREASELRARLREQAAARAAVEAEEFAAAQIVAGRMFPAERDAFAAMYRQCAADDFTAPLESGSRVAALRAQIETRPAHGFTQELTSGTARALRADGNDQTELSDERRKHLLAATPIGKAALGN